MDNTIQKFISTRPDSQARTYYYPTKPICTLPRNPHADKSSTKTQTHPKSPFYPPLLKIPKTPSPTYYKNPPPAPHFSNPTTYPFFSQTPKTTLLTSLTSQEQLAEILEDSRSKGVVTALYDALNRRDAEAIQKLLNPDLEWWFHGPPSHQFLMRLLTGEHESGFRFVPHGVSAFGPTVLAEGFDQSRSIAWVHAWTVKDGIITQVREYFNTSLTVTRFGKTDQSDCSIAELHCPSVWESSLPDRVGKSVPGLVLAI